MGSVFADVMQSLLLSRLNIAFSMLNNWRTLPEGYLWKGAPRFRGNSHHGQPEGMRTNGRDQHALRA